MSMVCPEGQPASQVAPSPVVVGPGAGEHISIQCVIETDINYLPIAWAKKQPIS